MLITSGYFQKERRKRITIIQENKSDETEEEEN
jgi:hypothetical protein